MSPVLLTPHSKITLRTILFSAAIMCLLGAVVAYSGYQARFLIMGPQIELSNEPDHLQNERTIILTGNARNLSRISLNGRQIFTDRSGYFSEQLVLEQGFSIVTLSAVDRFGRTTKVERSFVFLPATLIQ